MPIMYDGVSGVASSRAWTACTPCNVGYPHPRQRENYAVDGDIHQDPVHSARLPSSLGVAQCSDSRVKP